MEQQAKAPPKYVVTLDRLEGVPRGLRLTRYGGGDSFRSAREIFQCEVAPNLLPEDVVRRVCEALKVEREECNWETSFSISSNILGDDDSREPSKANLYFHGWLFEHEVMSGNSAAQKNPLIGIFSPMVGISEYVDRSLMGTTASAAINAFRAADQHIHTIDPFAGGSAESYTQLLIESGMTPEDAQAIAMVEALDANQYYMGSDSARVSLNLSLPLNQAWAVCVDKSYSKTRIFVTYLLVVTSKKLFALLDPVKKSEVLSKVKIMEEFKQYANDMSSLGL
jgi:hypothetical protein